MPREGRPVSATVIATVIATVRGAVRVTVRAADGRVVGATLKGWQRGPFVRKRGGVVVRLASTERELLARLLDDVEELLKEDHTSPGADSHAPGSMQPEDPFALLERAFDVSAPQDPAVARLLPDASRDDPEIAAGFRRLTEPDLRRAKREGAQASAEALRRPEPVQLSAHEAQTLLRSLTDLRLVIAERIGLRTDEDAAQLHEWLQTQDVSDEETSAQVGLVTIYEALTWWQESLVGALS